MFSFLSSTSTTTQSAPTTSTQKSNANKPPNNIKTTKTLLSKTTTSTPTSTKLNTKPTTYKNIFTTPNTTNSSQKTTPKIETQTEVTALNGLVGNSTEWFEVIPTDDLISTTEVLKDEWEAVGEGTNVSHLANINDVEVMFTDNLSGVSILVDYLI